jgi:hypothetical protein
MTLTATEIAPQLEPDFVIVGFIADDLKRSCDSFSSIASLAKPRFQLRNSNLYAPEAVPTPYENYLRHQTSYYRLVDMIMARLYSVRLMGPLAAPFIWSAYDDCAFRLNASLLAFLREQEIGKTGKVLFFHLNGELPDQFVQEMTKLQIEYDDLPANIITVADKIGASPDKHRDGHPKADLNKIYAFRMAQRINMLANDPAPPAALSRSATQVKALNPATPKSSQ